MLSGEAANDNFIVLGPGHKLTIYSQSIHTNNCTTDAVLWIVVQYLIYFVSQSIYVGSVSETNVINVFYSKI